MAQQRRKLAGKTALVTGAAKRIGRATALALAGEGADVVIHYRSSATEAEALARDIRQAGRGAWTVQADLARTDQAERLMPRAIELAGPIDVLVNNASIFSPSRLADLTIEELAENVNLHALAPLLLGRALADQGRQGAIVNFLDCRVTGHGGAHAAYHVSKRMALTLTRMMALEFAPAVRVNAVAPGLILAPPGQDDSYLARLASTNPLKRFGSVEAVTEAVLFLVHGDFVTGQVIFVDGGRHLRGATHD